MPLQGFLEVRSHSKHAPTSVDFAPIYTTRMKRTGLLQNLQKLNSSIFLKSFSTTFSGLFKAIFTGLKIIFTITPKPRGSPSCRLLRLSGYKVTSQFCPSEARKNRSDVFQDL